MGEFTKILKSFSLQDTLNPKIWENPDDIESSKMKPKVREALMKISEKFIDYLGDNVFVEDVTLTGSLSNYNWSEYSDFDLHILVDFQQYEKDAKLYQELFDARKYIFNESHNIKIYGYDVELYVQDVDEEHTSTGLYSVMNDEWLETPKKDFPDINKKLLVQKIDCWIEKIEKGIEDGKDLEKLKSKLKEYRKSGLEKEGELSYENLVFKFLRRSGHIGKLFDAMNKETDKELSVERQITEQNETLRDKINTIINNTPLLKNLKSFVDDKMKFEYTPGQKTPYSKDVEDIQNGLSFLGFKLPSWGVDGKFGEETKNSVKDFEKKFGLKEDGILDVEDLKYLTSALFSKGYKGNKINVDTSSDKEFYEKLLTELGAPVSDENMKFLYAWRQAEGKAGRFNPFNTTHKMPGSTSFNKVGVQHYLSMEDGFRATIKTLLNGRYGCIVDGLKNDIGANKISQCPSLEVWGTGDLVAKVLKGYDKGSSPKISSLA